MVSKAKIHYGVVFFVERWSFSLQDPIFWYFSNFQRLFRVRSASMTNKLSSRGVVSCYCHIPRHVRWNCMKL